MLVKLALNKLKNATYFMSVMSTHYYYAPHISSNFCFTKHQKSTYTTLFFLFYGNRKNHLGVSLSFAFKNLLKIVLYYSSVKFLHQKSDRLHA